MQIEAAAVLGAFMYGVGLGRGSPGAHALRPTNQQAWMIIDDR